MRVMNRSMLVLVFLSAACGNKDKECAAKKENAYRSMSGAPRDIADDRDDAKAAVGEAKSAIARQTAAAADLEERIKLFEQSMDCLVKKDCCKQLATYDNSQLGQVLSAGSNILPFPLPPGYTPQIEAVLTPLKKMIADNEGIIVAREKQLMKDKIAWCENVRVDLARVRKDASAAWKASAETAVAEVAKLQGQLDAARNRSEAISAWAASIKKGEKATIDPALSAEGGETYRRVETQMVAYNAACHGK